MNAFTIGSLVFCLLAALIPGTLALDLEERQLTISDIPQCGITCLLLTIPNSGCGIADTKCQCSNEQLAYNTAACMLANCTMADTLDTAKVQAVLCNLPEESQSSQILLICSIVFGIVTICVALRVAGKLLARRVSSDDFYIIGAMIFSAVSYACAYAMIQNGFGKHLWSLEHGQLKRALHFFYVCWNTYVITLGLVKVSLITFYLQIFQSRNFRLACHLVLVYVILNTLVISFLTIFACIPVQSFWDRDIKGKCLDVNAVGYANSASSIIQDIVILILPMPSLRKLNMKRWRKVAVGLMFAVGTFGCITTIIRLHTLTRFQISIDPTWDYGPVTIWTGLELASGIVCASLPSIRLLLTLILPKRLLNLITSRSRSRNTPTPIPANPSTSKKRGVSVFHIPSISKGSQSFESSYWSGENQSRATPEPTFAQTEARYSRWNGFNWLHLPFSSANSTRSFGKSFWSSVDHSHTDSRRHTRLSSAEDARFMHSRSGTPLSKQQHSHIELLQVPASTRPPCHSCGGSDDLITALSAVGCLPDGSYSRVDVMRDIGATNHHQTSPPDWRYNAR